MSEIEASAPSSTADIAAQVVESYDPEPSTSTGDDPAEPSSAGEVVPPGVTPPVEAKPQTPAIVEKPLSEEEQLLAEFGFKDAKKPDGRDHYIPRPKVLGMIASGLKRGKEKWAAERTTLETQANTYKADLDELYTDVRGEPKAFLEKIASHDPRYRAFLEPQAAPVVHTPAPVTQMPAPDVTLPTGERTYSLDGLQKLLEWNTAQVEAKLLPQVEERLKPWAERDKAEQARVESEKATTALRERVRSQVADAQTWPGFKEHEAAIQKALEDDTAAAKAAGKRPTLTLEGAYRSVVIPKLTIDYNTHRDKAFKELGAAAKGSPTVSRGGAETVRQPGPASTAEIARRVIDQMDRA